MDSITNGKLTAWRGLELVGLTDQGVRNEVWRGRFGGQQVSVRRARRSYKSLEWESNLIDHLGNVEFRVPRVVRTDSDEMHSEGIVVQEWMEGRRPSDHSEWRLTVDYLKRLHEATTDFPQRPDCCATTELANRRRSVDADIDEMPAAAREKVLSALAELTGLPKSVVHGDPGASNIRISEDGVVGFLDWDESRYDVSSLDLVGLPLQVLDDEKNRVMAKAHHAWEAANGWIKEPEYARRQLQLLDGSDWR